MRLAPCLAEACALCRLNRTLKRYFRNEAYLRSEMNAGRRVKTRGTLFSADHMFNERLFVRTVAVSSTSVACSRGYRAIREFDKPRNIAFGGREVTVPHTSKCHLESRSSGTAQYVWPKVVIAYLDTYGRVTASRKMPEVTPNQWISKMKNIGRSGQTATVFEHRHLYMHPLGSFDVGKYLRRVG